MKIIVTAETTDTFLPVSNITFPVIQEYCDRHGYEFRPKHITEPVRSVVWDRVITLQEALKDCDWAVHVDADCLITNMHIPLTEFIEEDKSIVISKAWTELGLHVFNDGFLMVDNSDWSSHTLKWAWENTNRPEVGQFCLQDGLQFMCESGRTQAWRWRIEKQKRCNAFLYQEYGMPETTQGQWTPGDFILHLPGMNNEKRVELLQHYSQFILR